MGNCGFVFFASAMGCAECHCAVLVCAEFVILELVCGVPFRF
jgi:hypothetical protein